LSDNTRERGCRWGGYLPKSDHRSCQIIGHYLTIVRIAIVGSLASTDRVRDDEIDTLIDGDRHDPDL